MRLELLVVENKDAVAQKTGTKWDPHWEQDFVSITEKTKKGVLLYFKLGFVCAH